MEYACGFPFEALRPVEFNRSQFAPCGEGGIPACAVAPGVDERLPLRGATHPAYACPRFSRRASEYIEVFYTRKRAHLLL